MSRRTRSGGALLFVVVATLTFSVGSSAAIADPDYPTWEEVQAARANQAAAAAAVDEIEGMLIALEAQATELGTEAQRAGEAYNIAKGELDLAVERASRLSSQADAARKRAKESTRQAGILIAQLARTTGGNPTVGILFSSDSLDLLHSLAAMDSLGAHAARIYRQAIADENHSRSLTDQAQVAEKRRAELASETEAAFAEAEEAAQAAIAAVQEHQADADRLYDQLATLKGTSAAVERE